MKKFQPGGYPAALLALMILAATTSLAANVTYDHRALVIQGKRRLLVSGSIHYPRSTPEMWPELIRKSKEGGLDMIETYVFWNSHEPTRGQYDFTGRNDLVKFVKLIAEAGLYAHLRIGPYVCAEWNYGGFPLWLHFIPGIKFRTDNQPFKEEMQRFTAVIVNLMKKNNLYTSQGGPIILSQIENEYGNIASAYGPSAKSYIKWAAGMALSLDTGVPWVMCQQSDAPDPIINTCNGFYCDQFTPNSNTKPKLWTENWSGWFSSFGNPTPFRPTQDLAFAVARFYQRGGTMQNYYMYHGGTNFDRTTGGPFISTTYDYDAPIDEYGLAHQPKWGHLKDVHAAVKLCQDAMLAVDPAHSSPAPTVEITVYKTTSGLCSAFLANTDTKDAPNVNFNGNSYQLPAWSVSILPDCKNVALNTAKINSMTTLPKFMPLAIINTGSTSRSRSSSWTWFKEPVGISKDNAFARPGLLEQINTTADQSDYLWYSLSIDINGNKPFLDNGSGTLLQIQSLGHGLHVFINGQQAGTQFGNSDNAKVSASFPIKLNQGKNTIDLLSLTVGLRNYGAFYDLVGAGVTGPVILKSSSGTSTLDLSSQHWTYQVGLKGEELNLGSGQSSSQHWEDSSAALPKNQPLTWYKTSFATPQGSDPVALDFTSMGKGEAWVNGNSIGRYWPTLLSKPTGCTDNCDYRGPYTANKCYKNCGKPAQQLYHVPRSWLNNKAGASNTLVLFEEVGGDPTSLSFAVRQTGSICSHISESHPPPVDTWESSSSSSSDHQTTTTHTSSPSSSNNKSPTLSLECPSAGQVISSITFASFGNPRGACGSFVHGNCHSNQALSVVNKACVGSRRCNVRVSIHAFGDPCKGVNKSLAVEAICSQPSKIIPSA